MSTDDHPDTVGAALAHAAAQHQVGFNVYPAEAEGVIGAMPGVLMVAGIGVPDPVLGEIGRYYIVVRPGSELTADAVVRLQGATPGGVPRCAAHDPGRQDPEGGAAR